MYHPSRAKHPDRLEEREGRLFITSISFKRDTPVMFKSWYPVKERLTDLKDHLGSEVDQNRNGTHFIHGRYCDLAVLLLNGHETIPEFTDTTPVLPPEVKEGIPLRWFYDGWQKCLKTRGWVSV